MAFDNGLLRNALSNDEHMDIRFGEAQNLLAYLSNTTRAKLTSCIVFTRGEDGAHHTVIVGSFNGENIRDYVDQAEETLNALVLAARMSARKDFAP